MATKPNKPARPNTGRLGEAIAHAFLERAGYVLVDVNVRPRRGEEDGRGIAGEIDVVAWDRLTLCFIEVKTRRGRAGETFPVEAVTPAKQSQIARLATAYAAQSGLMNGVEEIAFRFDVVSVILEPGNGDRVRHIHLLRGAFLAPDSVE